MSNTQGNFTFDGVNKAINCSAGTLEFSAGEIYSRWKDWLKDDPERMKFEPAFNNSVGGESLGSGTLVGAYFFLQNGWKIKPQEADHQLSISGNLFPVPDTAGLFLNTNGDYQIVVGMRVSSLTQTTVQSGSQSNTAIAEAVWDQDLTSQTTGAGKDLKDTKNTTKAILGVTA